MGRQYIFDPMGKIYPCWAGVKDSRFKIGQFHNDNYEINDDKLQQWKNRNVKNLSDCKSCKYQFFCGDGCAYKAIDGHGSIDRKRCPDFKNLFQSYLEYFFK